MTKQSLCRHSACHFGNFEFHFRSSVLLTMANNEKAACTTVTDYLKKTPHLRALLKSLPSTLPTLSRPVDPGNPNQLRDVFPSFQLDQEWLLKTEDLPGSVGKIFKLVFGWNTGHDKAVVFNVHVL
jgi:hypothetical protein